MSACLAFENLTGGYGSTTIVRDLSGAAAAGEVLCVLGRNGVGKSTLMKLLFGYLPCRVGRVLLHGKSVDGLDPAARRRLGMTFCPQERPVFDDLSVRDNLTLMRNNRHLSPFRSYFARFPILERRLTQHAGTLSGGEKKILSFVRGLAEDQPVVLLDEPSEVGEHPPYGRVHRREKSGWCGLHRGRTKSRLCRANRGPLSDRGPGAGHP
jgi:urea transport system ATP-binding protein